MKRKLIPFVVGEKSASTTSLSVFKHVSSYSLRQSSLYLIALMMLLLLVACGASSQPAPSSSKPKHTPTSMPSPSIHDLQPTPLSTAVRSLNPILPSRGVTNPTRLLIPSINVDATVEGLGILSNGDLATPIHNPWTDVGWYNAGPRPGEQGSAVIDGHLDRPGGFPAVFWNLRYLHPGDGIEIIDAHGKTIHFRVTQVVFYTSDHAPLQQIFGNNGGNYLNLITCAGDWIPSQHQTTLRLVVFTSLV